MINKPTKKVLLSLVLAAAANGCTNHAEQSSNHSAFTEQLEVQIVARHVSGQYGVSAAEILEYHPQTKSIFVVNAQSGQVDILDASSIVAAADMLDRNNINPLTLNNLRKKLSLNLAADLNVSRLDAVNSVAIHHNLLAVAIERGYNLGNPNQGRGFIGFYQIKNTGKLHYLHAVEVGYLPDNVVFTHDGNKVLVANEGEPNDYSVDPEGSVSIIRVSNGIPEKHAANLSFRDFNMPGSRHHELPQGLKINGLGATVAQDLEPEYITVSPNNLQAFVSLQENNGLAVIDLNRDEIQTIFALGSKHYGETKNAIDVSDKDGGINIQAYQGVYGLYQPDTIASYSSHGETFIVTANEGDSRDYAGFFRRNPSRKTLPR
jgi:DNA-binding beta-propeller fold protein YncE